MPREPRARNVSRPAKLASSQRAKIAQILDMVQSAGPVSAEGGDRTAFLYNEQGLPR